MKKLQTQKTKKQLQTKKQVQVQKQLYKNKKQLQKLQKNDTIEPQELLKKKRNMGNLLINVPSILKLGQNTVSSSDAFTLLTSLTTLCELAFH